MLSKSITATVARPTTERRIWRRSPHGSTWHGMPGSVEPVAHGMKGFRRRNRCSTSKTSKAGLLSFSSRQGPTMRPWAGREGDGLGGLLLDCGRGCSWSNTGVGIASHRVESAVVTQLNCKRKGDGTDSRTVEGTCSAVRGRRIRVVAVERVESQHPADL